MNTTKYKIIRQYNDEITPNKIIAVDLTLEEAQAHCRRHDTIPKDPITGLTIWFDGYDVDRQNTSCPTCHRVGGHQVKRS